jgi:hypothetical protein
VVYIGCSSMTIDWSFVIEGLNVWGIGNGKMSHKSKAGCLDFGKIDGNFT